MNIDEITTAANSLGIKLTNANEGTQLYQAWADRVLWADRMYKNLSKVKKTDRWQCQSRLNIAIAEANLYAV